MSAGIMVDIKPILQEANIQACSINQHSFTQTAFLALDSGTQTELFDVPEFKQEYEFIQREAESKLQTLDHNFDDI